MGSALRQSLQRAPGAWLLIATGGVAFFGVAWLGHYYDDFANIHTYRVRAFTEIARDTHFNRFPLFALGLYPLLLLLPAGVAHVVIAAAHTTAAVLLRAVLKEFGVSERVATSAALLFLVAPAHTEALHWVVASTVVFGVCCLLASTLALWRGRSAWALGLALAGMLFSEALILPSAALHAFVLLHQRMRLPRVMGRLVGMGACFVTLQALRLLASRPGRMAQYDVGLENVARNAADLLLMAMGMSSSRDINWFWNREELLGDVGLLLPPVLLLPAVVLMGGAVYGMSRLPGEPLRRRGLLLGVAGCLVGLLSALFIFLIITNNTMQPRYTYVPLVFLAPLGAMLLGLLDRGRAPRAAWMVALVAMLSWSLYRTWSHQWSNWYPARLAVERILHDVDATAKESGAQAIYVVNAPRLVGNAYVFMREWAYRSAGQQFLSKPVWLDDYPPTYLPEPKAGMRFSDGACVFLGWKEGRRVVGTRAFDPMRNLVLDCEKGEVELPAEGALPELRYAEFSEPAYRELVGTASLPWPPAP